MLLQGPIAARPAGNNYSLLGGLLRFPFSQGNTCICCLHLQIGAVDFFVVVKEKYMHLFHLKHQ